MGDRASRARVKVRRLARRPARARDVERLSVESTSSSSAISALDTRLDAAETDIANLEAADASIDSRLDALEAASADHEARIAALEASQATQDATLADHETRITALEP